MLVSLPPFPRLTGPFRSVCRLALAGCLAAGPLLSSCTGFVEPELPAATQRGLNTGGCRVDGRRWVAASVGLFMPPATSARYGGGILTFMLLRINEEEGGGPDSHIRFSVPGIKTVGTYELRLPADPSVYNGPAYGSYKLKDPSPGRGFFTGPAAPGRLVVTRLDSVGRIVSGTFDFTAIEAGKTAQVRVTEGRFDLKY